ncbi:MAG: divergent polysaccharide deacetylase family protein [Mariprofundaceae bacterium]|nr:divergent polysaccharide deacetylase family protein [Mariprofundaceae bacterium]
MPAWLKLLLACLFSLLLVLVGLATMDVPNSGHQARLSDAPSEFLPTDQASLSQVIRPLLPQEAFIYEDALPDPVPEPIPEHLPVTLSELSPEPKNKQAQQANLNDVGQLSLVIDDVGYNLNALQRLLALPYTITVAILPDAPHAQEAARMAHQHGVTVMLHMPMQTSNPKYQQNMERFYLHQGLSKTEFTQVFEDALAKIPYVQGINNHMGSLLTSDAKAMSWLMELCEKHDLFFLDSRTSSVSVAAEKAREQGLAWNKRNVFLDHKTDTASLQHAWNASLDCVQQKKQCVMIGHPHAETVAFLERQQHQLLPTFLVSITAVLKGKK